MSEEVDRTKVLEEKIDALHREVSETNRNLKAIVSVLISEERKLQLLRER